jgi:Cu(I)/Ag(I) efflux system membrane fusion protein
MSEQMQHPIQPEPGPCPRDSSTPPPSPPPPRGPRVGKLAAAAALLVAVLLAGAFLGGGLRRGLDAVWRSVSPSPAAEASAKTGQDATQFYTCGMHPWVILPKPGNCPICGMDLVPLDASKFTGQITIDPVVVQNIGVRTAKAEDGTLSRTIRTVGTVEYDERQVRDINTKVSGWIEKIHVDYLGAEVKKGEPLFELYSPDLYAAQKEYLVAYQNRGSGAADSAAGMVPSPGSLLDAARRRLLFYDITPDQIAALERSGEPAKTMVIRSPYAGVVTEKHGNEGMKVNPGMQVYRIADLSKVWVMATLYEYQLPYVQVGQDAVMSLPYIPGQTFEGKIVYIYPYLSEKSREVKVRIEFENPYGVLKPGMFANIDLQNTLPRKRVLVPRESIIDTGERQVAFVSLGEGRFEPRDVKMGAEAGDGKVEVLSGLKTGEQVVVSGQFLIDSESKMREALAKMIRGNQAADQESAPEVAPPVVAAEGPVELPDAASAALSRVLDEYLAIGETLAGDGVEGVSRHARGIAGDLDAVTAVEIPGHPEFWTQHSKAGDAKAAANALTTAGDLEAARTRFADLSEALANLVQVTGVPASFPKKVDRLHCPMFRKEQGGSVWLQAGEEVHNPYFGQSMLKCHDKRNAMPVSGARATGPGGDASQGPETGGE